MKLHDLKPAKGAVTPKTRVGRGIAAGKGKTAGRGTKGQKARSGGAKGPHFRGYSSRMSRLPFKRGFNNIFKIHYQEVNVGDLEGHAGIAAGATVTPALLAQLGLIRSGDKPLVVLGAGELSKKLVIQAHRFSKSATEKINAAGGATEPLTLQFTGARATVKLLPKIRIAEMEAKKNQNQG